VEIKATVIVFQLSPYEKRQSSKMLGRGAPVYKALVAGNGFHAGLPDRTGKAILDRAGMDFHALPERVRPPQRDRW
jgi:hypothetical protein